MLAIKGLGQFKEFRVVTEFRSLIENWQISDFHIAEARPSIEKGCAEHLSTRGDNLAQVAQYLHQYHPERFRAVTRERPCHLPAGRAFHEGHAGSRSRHVPEASHELERNIEDFQKNDDARRLGRLLDADRATSRSLKVFALGVRALV